MIVDSPHAQLHCQDAGQGVQAYQAGLKAPLCHPLGSGKKYGNKYGKNWQLEKK